MIKKFICTKSFSVYYNTEYINISKDKMVYIMEIKRHSPRFRWSVSYDSSTYNPYIGSDTYFVNTLCVISYEEVEKYFISLAEYREQKINNILN